MINAASTATENEKLYTEYVEIMFTSSHVHAVLLVYGTPPKNKPHDFLGG